MGTPRYSDCSSSHLGGGAHLASPQCGRSFLFCAAGHSAHCSKPRGLLLVYLAGKPSDAKLDCVATGMGEASKAVGILTRRRRNPRLHCARFPRPVRNLGAPTSCGAADAELVSRITTLDPCFHERQRTERSGTSLSIRISLSSQ